MGSFVCIDILTLWALCSFVVRHPIWSWHSRCSTGTDIRRGHGKDIHRHGSFVSLCADFATGRQAIGKVDTVTGSGLSPGLVPKPDKLRAMGPKE